MENLVEIVGNEPRISHRLVAKHTKNEQRAISQLIRNSLLDFEEFGNLILTSQKTQTNGGMQEQKTYLLNEYQFYLLITYIRNNEKVREFKKALVKEFYKLKQNKQLENKSNYKNVFLRDDWDFNRKIEFLLNQTQIELKATPKNQWSFFQSRSNYLSAYIRAMRAGGTELQKFTADLIDSTHDRRNVIEDKYLNLKAKYESFAESVKNMKKSIEIIEKELEVF